MINMQFNPLEDHPTWEKIQDLNRGSYGFVILARNKETGKEYALKFIERGQKITNNVEREILNHKKLRQHPYVIQLEAVFRTDSYLVLVLEYASGGSLRKYLASKGVLPESEARTYFQQLMLAVDYCHKMGVSSRDIKPDNILLDDNNEVKLADFGYSKDENLQSLANTRLGTPAYTAPEIFRFQQGMQKYDPYAVDIWSCGVTLFQMLCGGLPFKRPGDERVKHSEVGQLMLNRLLNGDFAFPQEIPLSDDVKDLLRCMLNTDPNARMKLKEISKHPWFQPGLVKNAMWINNMHAMENRQLPPSIEEVTLIKQIIKEAQTTVHGQDGGGDGSGNFSSVSCDMQSPLSERYD